MIMVSLYTWLKGNIGEWTNEDCNQLSKYWEVTPSFLSEMLLVWNTFEHTLQWLICHENVNCLRYLFNRLDIIKV